MTCTRLPPLKICIRPFQDSDWPQVWAFLAPTIAAGTTYAYPPESSEEELRTLWTRNENVAYVAEVEGGDAGASEVVPAGTIVGLFRIKPNQPGQGAHVANGSYVTSPVAQGRGVGRRLCEESQRIARERGFRAMQFNLVVATNVGAHALWESCGFTTVATLPEAFKLPDGRYVDAHIMFKSLQE